MPRHLRVEFGGDDAALDRALSVHAVDEHGCALVADRADEPGDQTVLQRLLEQDEEHEQRDRGDQEREADLGACHFLECEKHWGVTTSGVTVPGRAPGWRSLVASGVACQAGSMDYPVALYLQDAHTISQGIELVQYAESKGFDAVWQADSRLVRDAVVPMAAFAATTDRIKIGSGVIDCWTRNPARLASTFSTLDDLAPGRMICGLGAWWDPLAAKVGIDRARPLTVMREVVTAVRGAPQQRDGHDRRRTTSISTGSNSTTCTRSAARRTCRSTSVPPACR